MGVPADLISLLHETCAQGNVLRLISLGVFPEISSDRALST
jgi:hypothetical protein